jgi:hypothetical protein
VQAPRQLVATLSGRGTASFATHVGTADALKFGVANPAPLETPDPLTASTHLVQSTIELARAELRLALTRTGGLLTRVFGLLIAVAVAMPFLQVTLVLLALTPMLGALDVPQVALIGVGVPFGVSAVAGVFLFRAARSLTRELKQLSRGE